MPMTSAKPHLLWVWRDQPTRFGLGSQQRAAHILVALADYFRLHVVVLNEQGLLPEPPDLELLARCESRLQIIPDHSAEGQSVPTEAQRRRHAADLHFPAIIVERHEIGGRLVAWRRKKKAEIVLMFGFEVCMFLARQFEQLQPAYLDLDELLSKRQSRIAGSATFPPGDLAEARRWVALWQLMERRFLPLFSGILVSSAVEQKNVLGLAPDEKVTVVPNATRWNQPLPPKPAGEPWVILFVATMSYFPNLDAVNFFLGEIWPRLRARHGDSVRFHLLGSRAAASFQPDASQGIIFERNRPDLLPAYREADVVVAPIRAGGGTRVKILEAFALGRPVVSTTLGAEGLGVENGRHLLIADDPEDFASACSDLLHDAEKGARLVSTAAQWVEENNSARAVRAAVRQSRLVLDWS